MKVSKAARVVLEGRRKSWLYVLEDLTVTMDATAAIAATFGSIKNNSGRVGCDWVVSGDLDNNIENFFL